MGKLSASLFEKFRLWDRASQIGFISAILLLIPVGIVANSGPSNLQTPATIGAMGLVITAQAVFMWANRGMVTAYTKAQRLFLRGELEQARDLLEASGKEDFQTLTLLGNIYRQLGDLQTSHKLLYEALNKAPNHYFPLYGFGRTLLMMGDYSQAVQMIQQAIECGANPVVYFDLGESYFRQGDKAKAVEWLKAAEDHIQQEPHRQLMAAYLLYLADAGSYPSQTLIQSGLDYWQAQADRFAHTPYGQAVAKNISALQTEAN